MSNRIRNLSAEIGAFFSVAASGAIDYRRRDEQRT
jgi:hypothetical protein